MVLWLLPQNPTLRFALHKEQYLPLKDFSRAWIGMVVVTIGENVSHTGQKLFATDKVGYTEPIIQNFLSFIDYIVALITANRL